NMFLAADVPHLESLSASLFISGESRLYRGGVTCLLLIVAFSYRSVTPCNGALPRKSGIFHSFISANSSAELQHCHREAAEFLTSPVFAPQRREILHHRHRPFVPAYNNALQVLAHDD